MITISVTEVLVESSEVMAVRRLLEPLPFPISQGCQATFHTVDGEVSVTIVVPNVYGSGTCSRTFTVTPKSCEEIKSWLRCHFGARQEVLEAAALECGQIVAALSNKHALMA